MNAAESMAAGTAVGTVSGTSRPSKAPTRRVVDAPTRMMHWLLALSFLGAYLTADGERWRLVHVTLGYTLAGLLAARILWGLFGPRQVRLSVLWHKLRGLPAWLRAVVHGRIDWRQGHNLALAVSIVLLLLVIAPLTLSGLGLYQEWIDAEWVEQLHALLGDGMLVVALAHIVVVLVLSLRRRRNLVAPMITGRARGSGPDLVRRSFAGLTALLLASVLSFWTWQWQTAPVPMDDAQAAQSLHADND